MSDLNPEGMEKAARAIAGTHWRTAMDDARAAVSAYLGHTEVTTVEGLDALPVETTVRCESGTIETKIPDGRWICSSVWEPAQSSEIELPAHVIHWGKP